MKSLKYLALIQISDFSTNAHKVIKENAFCTSFYDKSLSKSAETTVDECATLGTTLHRLIDYTIPCTNLRLHQLHGKSWSCHHRRVRRVPTSE